MVLTHCHMLKRKCKLLLEHNADLQLTSDAEFVGWWLAGGVASSPNGHLYNIYIYRSGDWGMFYCFSHITLFWIQRWSPSNWKSSHRVLVWRPPCRFDLAIKGDFGYGDVSGETFNQVFGLLHLGSFWWECWNCWRAWPIGYLRLVMEEIESVNWWNFFSTILRKDSFPVIQRPQGLRQPTYFQSTGQAWCRY